MDEIFICKDGTVVHLKGTPEEITKFWFETEKMQAEQGFSDLLASLYKKPND